MVDGEVGDDTVDGGVADDVVRGGTGNDLLRPGPAPGAVTDSDEIVGGERHRPRDVRERGHAACTVMLDGAARRRRAGEIDDVQSDVEQVTGGSAADVLGGNTGANGLNGGPGADRLAGDGGDDALDGGGDPDVADGGDGNDSVAGGAGDDDVAGGNGDDVVDGSVAALVGADGNDRVSGGAGNDMIGGGDADDSLDGGPGADVMGGGPGTDTAEYSNRTAAAKVTVAGASAVNVRVSFNGRADDGISKENDNVGTDVENATTGAGNDTLRGGAGANGLTSGAGQDFLVGNRGGDLMSAGNNGDVILARDGSADGLDCGAGRDFAVVDKRETSTTGCEFLDKGSRRPSIGRRFIVRPLRGSALGFGAPGMTRWAPLAQTLQLPVQARVRARGGAVRLISANRSGRQSAVVGGAAFVVKQARRGNGLTELSLRGGNFARCASAGEATAAGSRRVRRLFGRGRGRFRTRGRNSSATVRGTRWTVEDRCDGTLTRVQLRRRPGARLRAAADDRAARRRSLSREDALGLARSSRAGPPASRSRAPRSAGARRTSGRCCPRSRSPGPG